MNIVLASSDVVTAYGWGIEALWQGLLSGVTAIGPTERFAPRGFVSDQAAVVPDLEPAGDESRMMAMLRRLLRPLQGTLDPATPLILATTVGEIEYVERAVLVGPREAAIEACPDRLLQRLKTLLGLRGSGLVVSCACASSAAALALAAGMVRQREAPAVLVVAGDSLSEFVYAGFSGLLSLSGSPARPFDAQRDGLSLGEAAAWALVAADDSPWARGGATAILGWGTSTDAVHMTAPDRHGGGLIRAVRKALRMAQCPAEQVACIAAHGTGTRYSDAMEIAAFQAVFPAPRPVFSLKGGIGHSLGPTGLIQVLALQQALARGWLPPTVGLRQADPLAREWVHTQPVALPPGPRALSSNSGFGGVNTAILLGGRTSS